MLKGCQLPIAKFVDGANSKLKSRAWNDSKVGAHHAIIPTEKSPARLTLNNFEKNIYQLICQQYLMQFYPAHCYQQIKVSIAIAGGLFQSSAKIITQLGWKALIASKNIDADDEQNASPAIASLTTGQQLHCQQGHLLEKQTEPPKHFTDASLLAAMTNIARFVTDKALKAILKDTDGLGTEATRAGIIDLLFKRGFLQRSGKQIHATDAGKGLIAALPIHCTQPDMTAQWK